MLLFLDFDGVLHPEYDGMSVPPEVAFRHLPRFEAVMRDFHAVEVVISSMWRYHYSLDGLKTHFSPDIAARIIGTTPLIEREEGKYLPDRREGEILKWLAENGREHEDWIAVDDAAWQFPKHRNRVIGCVHVYGLDDEAADVLRTRLTYLLGLGRPVTVYQLAGELSVLLHTGETITDNDPEALAEQLFQRGYRTADVHIADWREADRSPGAGQAIALKWKLRQLGS